MRAAQVSELHFCASKVSSSAAVSNELKKVNILSSAAALSRNSFEKRRMRVYQASAVTCAGDPSKKISETLKG